MANTNAKALRKNPTDKVLRFWDNHVLTETGAVMEVITQALEDLKGPPS